MSNRIGSLRIFLGLDSAAFNEGLDEARRRLAGTARQMEAIGSRLQGLGQSLSVGVTLPLTALGTASVAAARRQEQAVAAVEAALASMGEVAGFTSGQLQEMASSLQARSLFGDEEILERVTANLLTFGNISGDVFARAQQAALDLSARLGQDLQSSTLQLGKALNDPIAGVSALQEVGVSFTEQQREQIKAMTEAGQVAEAQALILSELERQYSGQAEALARTDSGQITQALNTLGDAAEKIGAVLLPVLADVATTAAGIAERFSELSPRVQTFIVAGGALAAALGPVALTVGTLVTGLGAFLPLITVLAAPVGAAAAAIAGLGAAAFALYRNWDDVVARVAEIRDALADMGAQIRDAFLEALRGVVDGVAQIFTDVRTAITEKVTAVVEDMRSAAGDIAAGLRDGITSRARAVGDAASGLADRFADGFRDRLGIRSPSTVFRGFGGDIVDGLIEGIRASEQAAISAADRLGLSVGRSAAASASQSLDRFFRDLSGGQAGGAFRGLFDSIGDQGRNSWGSVVAGAFRPGGGGIGAIGQSLSGAFRALTSSVGSLFSGGGMTALSGVIGSALPIVGAVSGLVNLVRGFSSTRTIGGGLNLGIEGGDVAGGTFERVRRTRFWGLSRRDFDRVSAFDAATAAAFQERVSGIQAGVRETFERLGVGVSDAAIRGVSVGVRRIDTTGLSEEQVATQISAIFAEYTEGLSQALGGVAFEAARTLADVADILRPAGQLFFGSVQSMAAAAGDLARLAGGTESLARGVATFADLFFSEEERLGVLGSRISEVFGRLSLAVPATADAFKELVLSQDLMTASGREAYAALIDVAPAFRSAADAAQAATEAQSQQLREQIDGLRARLAQGFDLSRIEFGSSFEARFAQAASARGLPAPGGFGAIQDAAIVDPQIAGLEALMRKQVTTLEQILLLGIPGRA